MKDIDFIENMCERGLLEKHHSATSRGYMPIETYFIDDYKGRFGEGYTILSHNDMSTKYCIITYYIFTKKYYDTVYNIKNSKKW